jgi:hypothetical protein
LHTGHTQPPLGFCFFGTLCFSQNFCNAFRNVTRAARISLAALIAFVGA